MLLARELRWETDEAHDDAPMWSAEDDANEDRSDESAEISEAELDDSSGVFSDAGGLPVLVLASHLQTGQKVLHDVSQESTQKA